MSLMRIVGGIALPILGAATWGAPPAHALDTSSLVWMISTEALAKIAAQPAGPGLIEKFFDNPRTFVLTPADQLAQVPPKAVATINFASFAAMRDAFGARKVDARYGAVLYDCEAWTYTPSEEQKNPIYYYGLAEKLAHNFKLKFLAAPATTLRTVLLTPSSSGDYPPFMKTGIVGPIASVADVFEIQAQGSVAQSAQYQSLVASAAQAAATNPKVVFLAGLSTGPDGQTVTATQLFNAIAATRSTVAGYWLNIPEKSGYCTACGTARPDVAVNLLQLLQKAGNS
jgi:hypothetical protein